LHVWVREEAYTGSRWKNLRKRDNLDDAGVSRKIILSWISRKWDVRVRNWSIWLRIETGGKHLRMW
jgi:hypothetical protein